MDNMAELGIGGLFAMYLIKTVLPYVKPAKAKENGELLKVTEKQTLILEKMNERDIVMLTKTESTHENIKNVALIAHDINTGISALHKRMDKKEK